MKIGQTIHLFTRSTSLSVHPLRDSQISSSFSFKGTFGTKNSYSYERKETSYTLHSSLVRVNRLPDRSIVGEGRLTSRSLHDQQLGRRPKWVNGGYLSCREGRTKTKGAGRDWHWRWGNLEDFAHSQSHSLPHPGLCNDCRPRSLREVWAADALLLRVPCVVMDTAAQESQSAVRATAQTSNNPGSSYKLDAFDLETSNRLQIVIVCEGSDRFSFRASTLWVQMVKIFVGKRCTSNGLLTLFSQSPCH